MFSYCSVHRKVYKEWPSIEPGPSQTEVMAMPNMFIEIINVPAVLQFTPCEPTFSAAKRRFQSPIESSVWNPVIPRRLSKTTTALF